VTVYILRILIYEDNNNNNIHYSITVDDDLKVFNLA
jgi:hypothetical protein